MENLVTALSAGLDIVGRLYKPKFLGGISRKYTFLMLQGTQRVSLVPTSGQLPVSRCSARCCDSHLGVGAVHGQELASQRSS